MTLLNTAFNKTKVYYQDTVSNLTTQWFMHVKVVDLNDKPVIGANVEVKDTNDVVVGAGVTGSDGYLRWIVTEEYYQNDANGDTDGEDPGEKIFYTPHNVTAWKDGDIGWADPEPFMNESKVVIVRIPMAYTTYTITKYPLQGNVTVGGVQYPAPAIFNWLPGENHNVSVDSPEYQNSNIKYIFDYWDDSGAQTHDVIVGSIDKIITAYYKTQYKPNITLMGTDASHTVTAYHTKDGIAESDPGTFNSWSDWCDNGTSLSFDVDATGSTATERWHTYEDFAVSPWISVSSPFSATVVYYHQYNVTITTTGLVSSYPATITATQAGNPINPTTYTMWNDWIDADSTLSIDETVTVSATERYHTIDTFSWIVNSPIIATVNYYHQYLVTVTTTGLDPAYPATISVTQHGTVNNPTTSTSWSDWADNSTTLSIEDTIMVSGTERYHTIDTVSWIANSPIDATVNYYHQYLVTITTIGLDSAYPATISVSQHGTMNSLTTSSSWSDWADNSTTLSIEDTIMVSGTERYHTIDAVSWPIGSALSVSVSYYHQYLVTITTIGLDATFPATISVVQHGSTNNPTTSASWSDWADASSTLGIEDTVTVSARERYHTTDAVSWTVNSALSLTVNYIHQYMPIVTLVGTDSSHAVNVQHTLDCLAHDDIDVFNSWSDWADKDSTLTFDICTTGTPTRCTIDNRSFIVDSSFDATITYTEAPPTVTYTITKSPLQGYVIVDNVQYVAPAVFNWVPGEVHNISVDSPEFQDADTRYIFEYWDDNGAQTHQISVGGVDKTITAFYKTQHKPNITLIGTDEAHTVTAYRVKNGLWDNDTGVRASWSDWVDENTTLSFDECTSGSLKRCTTDTRIWTVESAFDATIRYTEKIVDEDEEVNYKPLIALIFSVILLLFGTYVSFRKPLKFTKNERRHKLHTWLIAVLPFVIAEAITGIVSLLTGLLSIPPLTGAGMVVDLAILIIGLIVFVLVYIKKPKTEE